jgi:hypothetical protein
MATVGAMTAVRTVRRVKIVSIRIQHVLECDRCFSQLRTSSVPMAASPALRGQILVTVAMLGTDHPKYALRLLLQVGFPISPPTIADHSCLSARLFVGFRG